MIRLSFSHNFVRVIFNSGLNRKCNIFNCLLARLDVDKIELQPRCFLAF